MNDYTKPVYRIDGKEFKTIDGMQKYLFKKHAPACEMSGVRQVDRTFRVYGRGSTGKIVIATYSVSAPEIGKPMTVTQSGGVGS